MSRGVVAAVFVAALLVIPSSLYATEGSMMWWRHTSTSDACLRDAQAAMAVSGLTDVRRIGDNPWIIGRAGEYLANAFCIDQTATLFVAGPDEHVAESIRERVRANWR